MTIAGRRGLAVLALTAVTVVSMAACTSSGSGTGSSGPAPSSATSSGDTSSASPSSGSGKPTPAPTATVPSGTATTKAPVPISSQVAVGRGVTARISSVRAVDAKADLPGEIGGPAVLVTISLRNDSRRAVALEPVVNLYYGAARTPAGTISGSPSKPFGTRLAAGRSASGSYTFTLGTSQRSTVRIEFGYAPTAPVVLWQGSV